VATANLLVARNDAVWAIVDGRLEEALRLIKRSVERADEVGAPVSGRQLGATMLASPAFYLGRAEIFLSALEEYTRLVPLSAFEEDASLVPPALRAPVFVMLTATRAISLAHIGRTDEARKLANPLLDDVAHGSGEHEATIQVLTILPQTAVVLKHCEGATALIHRLACVAHPTTGDVFAACVARHLVWCPRDTRYIR
jgi:hypothetical protein